MIIGLIKEQRGEVRITDAGFVLRKIMQLEEIDSLEKLEEIKKETSRKKGVSLATKLTLNQKEFYAKFYSNINESSKN